MYSKISFFGTAFPLFFIKYSKIINSFGVKFIILFHLFTSFKPKSKIISQATILSKISDLLTLLRILLILKTNSFNLKGFVK